MTIPERTGAKKVLKERSALPETLVVESVMTIARAGSVASSVHWAPFSQRSPTISAKIKIKFLFRKRYFGLISILVFLIFYDFGPVFTMIRWNIRPVHAGDGAPPRLVTIDFGMPSGNDVNGIGFPSIFKKTFLITLDEECQSLFQRSSVETCHL